MDNRDDVRDFLTTRRARVRPEDVGFRSGSNRRVPGLRRSEVASLAGVSVEYYARIERGAIGGASVEVLDALARALQLDEAERTHLFDLAAAASGSTPRPRSSRSPAPTRESLQWALDAITAGPAFVRNGRMDLVAANRLGRAFYRDVLDQPRAVPNLAWFTFLDPRGRPFHPEWEKTANTVVAILRTEAGRDPHDRELHDLVGELSTRSEEFRSRWADHHVRLHGSGTKHFHHPVVGELTVAYEGLEMVSDPGLTLTIYTAEPASASEERLRLLASWAATEAADLDADGSEADAPAHDHDRS